jgi:hypothetical protein
MTPEIRPTDVVLCSVGPDSSSNPLPRSLNNIRSNCFHVQERKDRKEIVMMIQQMHKSGETGIQDKG